MGSGASGTSSDRPPLERGRPARMVPEPEEKGDWLPALSLRFAPGAAPLRILVAVPALEALLFLRPSALARAFPTATEDLVTLGRLTPRDALTRIAPDHDGPHAAIELTRALDAQDITALRIEPPLRDLLIFLNELRTASMAAAGLAGS